MKAVFLCRRLAGYMFESIQYFSQKYNVDSVIVTTPADPNAPFEIKKTKYVEVLSINAKTEKEWADFIGKINPDLIYMAGWAVPTYKKIVKSYVNKIPVIMGMDAQWEGSFRQRLGTWASSYYVRPYCNHVWVAGDRQFEFAKRLGFRNDSVLTGFYTADTPMFQAKYSGEEIPHFGLDNPKKIVFVGRYVEVKEPRLLIEAFNAINPEISKDWELIMIGAGELKDDLKKISGSRVKIMDFMQPEKLNDLLAQCHAFCLPSSYEPWGVVVHEAACMGLPLILSDACGAATEFLIHGYNGFSFKSRDKAALTKAMTDLFTIEDSTMKSMRKNSFLLSNRITHDTWAGTLFGVLKK